MKYTSRVQLLRDAADSIEMQEKHGIIPTARVNYLRAPLLTYGHFYITNDWEFPLAVVEGKPVFVGDELYLDGNKIKTWNGMDIGCLPRWSWNPPKPKTVMVELLVEDAERCAKQSYDFASIADACRKALESLK